MLKPIALAAVACLFALPSLAAADRVFPSLRLEPAVDAEGIGFAQYGAVPDEWGWDAALMLGYENNPLFTFDDKALDPNTRKDILVANRVTLDGVFALSLFNWAELGLDVPMVLTQDGAANLVATSFGDVTVWPKIRIVRQMDGAAVDIALLAPFTLPSGQLGDFTGERQMHITPGVAVSREFFRHLRVAVNLGHRFRDVVTIPDLTIGDELIYKLGAGYDFDLMPDHASEISLSLSGAAATDDLFRGGGVPFVGAEPSHPVRNPVEAMIGVRTRVIGDLDAFVDAGHAIIAGYGVPDYRVLVGLRWSDRPPYDYDGDGIVGPADKCPRVPENKNGHDDEDGCPDADDTDGDGIYDDKDKCPTQPEDKDGYQDEDGCPDLDDDSDGIPDTKDRCRLVPEDKDGFEDEDGCPDPDNDGDGIPDATDKCPNEAEDRDGFQDEDGCPDPDNDGDGFKDADDACPNEAGIKQNKGCPDKDRDGDTVVDRLDNCPDEPGPPENGGCKKQQLVVITDAKLEIKDKIYFDTDKDTIQPKSFPLLDNVAAVMNAHPEIKKIRVEGHTDNVGNAPHNKDLSNRRAGSVMKYLVDKGHVDAARLTAEGFGMDRPIATNDTVDGKALNRRVEFVIVDDSAPAPTP